MKGATPVVLKSLTGYYAVVPASAVLGEDLWVDPACVHPWNTMHVRTFTSNIYEVRAT